MNLSNEFLNTLDAGLFVVDVDLNVYFWNDWLEVHTGIAKETIEQKKITDFFPIESEILKHFKRSVKVALALKNSTFFSASVHSYLLPIKLKKIRTTFFDYMQQDVTISPIDLDKKLVSVTIYNQTNLMEYKEEIEVLNRELQSRVEEETSKRVKLEIEQVEQEKNLIKQSKMAEMGSMIAAIAHQFKQPLNVIALHAQELMDLYEYDELNEQTISDLEHKIIAQVGFMSTTVSNFANFFKPVKHRENFSVEDHTKKTVFLLSKQLTNHSVSINVAIEKGLVLFGLSNEFQQVIFNLINNAKDAAIHRSLDNCSIRIEGKRENGNVVISVSDTACGIEPDIIDKIFESYFTTKGENGTGIGLTIVKTIIEKEFAGTIEVKNIEGGASFIITIPEKEQVLQ